MSSENGTVELIAVNVALPEIIGMRRGKPVSSAIKKRRTATNGTLHLTTTNLEGDRQGDLRVHGGPDKAVYAYPSEHLPLWTAELQPDEPFGPGAFGENLTTAGWLETDVRIGDVWEWGEARLQVCQPRYPCFKLAMAAGRPQIVKRFLATGRSGWYIRVLEPGMAPVRGPITLHKADPAGVTVREAAMAVYGEADPDRRLAIADHPALAERWQAMLRHLATNP